MEAGDDDDDRHRLEHPSPSPNRSHQHRPDQLTAQRLGAAVHSERLRVQPQRHADSEDDGRPETDGGSPGAHDRHERRLRVSSSH